MELSISNLAWDPKIDEEISELLIENNISNIDIAPSKYFTDISRVSKSKIRKIKSFWAGKGIKIYGMQSLFFGTEGMNMFGDMVSKKRMLNYFKKITELGYEMGARKLVFGSPINRDCSLSEKNDLEKEAVEFFKELALIVKDFKITICIEPIPKLYGCNFINTSKEAIKLIREINLPEIKLQLDLGSININKENIEKIITFEKDLIGFVHISEPNLMPIGTTGSDHKMYSDVIKKLDINSVISIEMLTSNNNQSINSIKNAILFVKNNYF